MLAKVHADYESPKRNSLKEFPSAQEIFERDMSEELFVFRDILLRAHEMTMEDLSKKSPNYQNRNSKASRMNENIRGILFDTFGNEMHETPHRRFYLSRKGYKCYFKKLFKDIMPRHVETEESEKILTQSQTTLNFKNEPVTVFIGYVPDKNWEELKYLCAVYICSKKVVWVTNLEDFAAGISQIPIFLPKSPDDDDEPLKVTPKIKGGSTLDAS